MTNKDVFKILLCTYGYDRNIIINTYYGEGGWIGYEIHAENKDGNSYNEENCEGFLFHIHCILDFMRKNNVSQKALFWNYPIKFLLDDTKRENIIKKDDDNKLEHERWCEAMKPAHDWEKANHPCRTCQIKQDYDDIVHYNCWLCHAGDCEILEKFNKERDRRRRECQDTLK